MRQDSIDDKNTYLGPALGYIDLDSLNKLVGFHGFLTSGAFIGLQMLALAKQLLHVKDDERIHVECETVNCVPDVFQIMAGATVGNKGLIIKNTGKMAVTITKHSPPGSMTRGVRIFLDPEKTKKFGKLHAWYLNTGKFGHEEIIPILRQAGKDVYSYKFVQVPVPHKPDKRVGVCPKCKEAFVIQNENQTLCPECIEK